MLWHVRDVSMECYLRWMTHKTHNIDKDARAQGDMIIWHQNP